MSKHAIAKTVHGYFVQRVRRGRWECNWASPRIEGTLKEVTAILKKKRQEHDASAAYYKETMSRP